MLKRSLGQCCRGEGQRLRGEIDLVMSLDHSDLKRHWSRRFGLAGNLRYSVRHRSERYTPVSLR